MLSWRIAAQHGKQWGTHTLLASLVQSESVAAGPGGSCTGRRFSSGDGVEAMTSTDTLGISYHPISLPPSLQQRRKFSFPAALHSNLLGLTQASENGAVGHVSARRRFSNVSDAVSRKLSNTIGWRTVATAPTQEIVEQGKSLCSQYIRNRLKRSGVFNRKCGLQRLRNAAVLPGGVVVGEVFPELVSIGQELERMHPKLYTSVTRQASASPGGGILASDKAPGMVLTAVGRELFKVDVTWGKVVSLFAIAGGLGVDCVRQGHPDYLQGLMEAMGEVLEDEVAPWIIINGGWVALLSHCRPPVSNEMSATGFVGLFLALLAAVLALLLFLPRWIGTAVEIPITLNT